MNVVRENLENQTAMLRVTVSESDYKAEVDKQLKDYKRKATVPGFRPGMVPMGVINKMYRKGALAETTYRKATDGAFEYVKENNIETVGDLMPSETQPDIDFDNNTEFEFLFELGLAPEIDLNLGKKDGVTKYVIKPNSEMLDGFRSNYTRRFGKLVDVDTVVDEEALTGTLTQGEDTKIEDAYVGLISMDEEARKPFIGKKVGDTIEVDANEIYKTASQRASILGVKEDELEGMDPKYTFTIEQIRKFAEPEMDAEFFKLAFPEGDITTTEQFDAKITEQVSTELAKESGYKFSHDLRTYLLGKANLTLPEAFLKKWLFAVNEGKFTMEDIEKEFPQFLEMISWDLIRRKVMKDNDLEITQDDVKAEAKEVAMKQFQYYGMHTVADDMLENFLGSILENKEEVRKIYDAVGERKVVAAISEQIKVTEKSCSSEEFQKL